MELQRTDFYCGILHFWGIPHCNFSFHLEFFLLWKNCCNFFVENVQKIVNEFLLKIVNSDEFQKFVMNFS